MTEETDHENIIGTQGEIKDRLNDIQIKMDNHLEHEHAKINNRLSTIESAVSDIKDKVVNIDPASQRFVAVMGVITTIAYLVIVILIK